MISVLLGCLGYSLLNISQAVQKIGLAQAAEKRLQGLALWCAATLGTLAASFIVFAAVSLGNASLVGAMAATGLAALAVFSHVVMKERVGVKEIAAIVVIILAAALIGLFSIENRRPAISTAGLFLMTGAVIGVCLVFSFAFRKKGAAAGIVIGVFSGGLGGFVPLFQKAATSELGKAMSLFPPPADAGGGFWDQALAAFANPFAAVWIFLSLASMAVLQFAYKKAEAIRIIPFFTATGIVIPVIGGVIALGERLHPVQWAGLVILFSGLLLLTIKRRKNETKAHT